MTREIVLTIIGSDKIGIVQELSSLLVDNNAKWLDARMAHLGGEFAGMLKTQVEEENYQSLISGLERIRASGYDLTIKDSSEESSGAKKDSCRRLTLDVVGADREGIVHDITSILTHRSINIEELNTEFFDSPISEPLFKASAELSASADVDLEDVQGAITAIAGSLMIELHDKL